MRLSALTNRLLTGDQHHRHATKKPVSSTCDEVERSGTKCAERDPRLSRELRDRPTSPRSPWQNAYAERLIGSIRRECVDHIVVVGERHLRHVLLSYMSYYNNTRTHLSLNKDAPISRAAETVGRIIRRPILGGLHQ